jgi:hypothetical protein
MAEVIAAVDRIGFKCTDVAELHRTPTNFALQLDLVFVPPPLFAKYGVAAGIIP